MLSLSCTTTGLRAADASGEVTPQDVLAQVTVVDPAIDAIGTLDVDGARLAVTVEESVAAVGLPWRDGLAAHADRPPSTFDVPPTARLREAGAVIVGTTAMPDMGMTASGVSSMWEVTRPSNSTLGQDWPNHRYGTWKPACVRSATADPR